MKVKLWSRVRRTKRQRNVGSRALISIIMIDNKLNWKNHICLVKSKLSKSCAVMHRASFLIDRRGMNILYYSLFLPYIMYCAEVWGNTYATNVQCSMFSYITEKGYKVTLWCQETGPYNYAIL